MSLHQQPIINTVQSVSIVPDGGGGNYSAASVDTLYSHVVQFDVLSNRAITAQDLRRQFEATSRFNTIYVNPSAKGLAVAVSIEGALTAITEGTATFQQGQFNVPTGSPTKAFRIPTREAGALITLGISGDTALTTTDRVVFAYAYIPDNREVSINGG